MCKTIIITNEDCDKSSQDSETKEEICKIFFQETKPISQIVTP